MTSVFDFYQFWVGLADEGVEDYLRVYTLILPDELTELMQRHGAEPGKRMAQKKLASAVTEIVYGAEQAAGVARATEILFNGEDDPSDEDFEVLAEFLPVFDRGVTVVDVLVQASLSSSKAAARQLIKSGAIVLDGKKITEDMEVAERAIIRRGKNKFVLVK
jgi:tyrosyl-tRNA synthetase